MLLLLAFTKDDIFFIYLLNIYTFVILSLLSIVRLLK